METGLLRDFLGNFSMRGERYYFHMKGSTLGGIEPMQGEIETNLGNGRWREIEIRKLGNFELGVLDLHKSGNELSLDLHKSSNELSLDLHKSGNELSLDLYKSSNELSLDLQSLIMNLFRLAQVW